ncbi:hypothetical protein [Luteolibacter sp. Populi]|uniref:hypothetical protein n=1 Tax=Luteolibacter sp. Populi TaxID=3230487 RepID=UPI0034658DAB
MFFTHALVLVSMTRPSTTSAATAVQRMMEALRDMGADWGAVLESVERGAV